MKIESFTKRSRRATLLMSVAVLPLAVSALNSTASASDWTSTFWGGPFPIISDPLIADFTAGGTVTVNIDNTFNSSVTTNTALVGNSVYNVTGAGTINSPLYGIWSTFDSTSTAVIDGKIIAAGNGLGFNTVLGTVGDQTISGVGSVDAGGYGLWLVDDKGKIDVSGLNGGIKAGSNAIYAISTTGDQTYEVIGPIESTLGYGIAASSLTGDITADGKGASSIKAAIDGVYLNTVSLTAGLGNITVQNYTEIKGGNNGVTANFGTGGTLGDVLVTNNGDISGTIRNGIETYTFGNTTITGNGLVDGAINGIAANFAWASPGDVLIDQQKNVTGGGTGSGIVAGSGVGDIDITATAETKGGTGIWAVSTLGGNVSADGGGTGKLTGTTVDGIRINTSSAVAGSGLATVENFTAGISGLNNGVTVNFATGGTLGDVSVINNGDIKGDTRNGIETYTFGNTTITGNGEVNGAINGIAANFAWASPGDVLIDQQKNVTGGGTGSGIVAGSGVGDIDITAGGITKGGTGIWALASLGGDVSITVNNHVIGTTLDGILSSTTTGNQTIKIDSPAVVEGLVYGLVTSTTGGIATTNNTGIIQNTQDALGASSTAGFQAVWLGTGNNILNNNAGGKVIGGITDSSIGVFNNNAGGIWIPSLLNAQTAVSTNNNAGIINVRQGATVGVGVTNNLSGGLVDLTYGGTSPLATDYFYTYDYNAASGSISKFNVDFTLANGLGTEALADDHSSNGLGTADTIGSIANPTPGAGAKISLVNVGAPGVATSGSIALILPGAGPAGMVDPTLAGLPTLVQSSNYVFDAGSDPSSGAVKVVLQEDAFGGVHLRWAPNITAESLGGFAGGTLGDADSAGASIAGAAAAGGVGGAGAGGGAAGSQIGDIAASNAFNQSGPSGGSVCGDGSRKTAWIGGDGASTDFDGGGSGSSINGAFGLDYDLSQDACGRFAIGGFGTIGHGTSSFASGSSNTDSLGAGAYARFSAGQGLYGLGLVAIGSGDTEMTNNVFGSTAKQNSTGLMGMAAIGYATRMTDTSSFDMRGYVSQTSVDGDGFTDSAGIVVSGSKANFTTVGAEAKVSVDLTQDTTAFLGAGIRHVSIDQSMTAFGITVAGSTSADFANIEAGLRHALADNITVSASATGDFSKSSDSLGAKVGLAIKF